MSRLTLRLPETLHSQLSQLAEVEGVSLNQYIVYALTRQVGSSYSVQVVPSQKVAEQAVALKQWLDSSNECSETEAAVILNERDSAEPEPELSADMIARFQSLLRNHS